MKWRTLLFSIPFAFAIQELARADDLRLDIGQSFVDKAFGEQIYPLTLVDSSVDCDLSNMAAKDKDSATAAEVVSAATQNKQSPWSNDIIVWADEWSAEVDAEISNKAALTKAGHAWQGPNDKELADLKALRFPVKPCITHQKIQLSKKPTAVLDPPGVKLDIPAIDAGVHIKIFFWNPFHHCKRKFCIGNVCVCYDWDPGWDPIGGGFDFSTSDITAKGQLAARTAGSEAILDPTIDRLRLAPPWDWIPLEKFVNKGLEPLHVLDVSTIQIDVLAVTLVGKTAKVYSAPGTLAVSATMGKK